MIWQGKCQTAKASRVLIFVDMRLNEKERLWVLLIYLCRSGRYRTSINLLRKFLGDYLIASYLSAVQESGFDDGYVKEIEVHVCSCISKCKFHCNAWSILLCWKQRAVLLKTLDCFWRDHLVNMNKLSSAVSTVILICFIFLFAFCLSDTYVLNLNVNRWMSEVLRIETLLKNIKSMDVVFSSQCWVQPEG